MGSTDSAPRRTWLAAERTYLAWLRTAFAALGLAIAVGRLLPALVDARPHRLRRCSAPATACSACSCSRSARTGRSACAARSPRTGALPTDIVDGVGCSPSSALILAVATIALILVEV